METARNVLSYISFGVGCIGAAVILWGIILSVARFLRCEARALRGRDVARAREALRHRFGTYLLLGLEFLIAADVIETIVRPTLVEVAILGSIVLIRTVISYFLDREMAAFHSSGTGR